MCYILTEQIIFSSHLTALSDKNITYIHIHRHTHTIYIHIYIHIHIYTHIYTHTYMHACMHTVNSRYLGYSVSRNFPYLELFSRTLGHFTVTQAKILSLSRTSICRNFRYLELIFRSLEEQTLVISNFSNFFCFKFRIPKIFKS